MATLPFLLVLLLLALTTSSLTRANQNFPQFRAQQPNNNNPYKNVRILDPGGNYKLEWLVETDGIFFTVTVKTRGWVGFGLNREASMTGADMIMGGVDDNGKSYFKDRYATGNKVPTVDAQQDWKLHYAGENYTHTTLHFFRVFQTCDPQDIPITEDTLYVLWAYGVTDDTSEYHHGYRGSVPIYLRDPDYAPPSIQEDSRFSELERQGVLGSDVKIWSIPSTFKVPAKRTTYMCTIHRGLDIYKKHHIIGNSYQISNETASNVHHVIFYRCVVDNPSKIFERFVDQPGQECYNLQQPLGEIPTGFCTELKIGHTIGGRPLFLPESVGIAIGTTGQTEYFMLQTHYDNPNNRSDLVVDTQLDLYYTSKVRPNDGGTMSIGHNIPGSPSILLPPQDTDHRIFGQCSSPCTNKMFPPEGIKIVGGVLHAHTAGRRVTFQHFRNNQELPPLLSDDNWKFNFQPMRLLKNEVTILPGDYLATRCYYDTTETTRTTVGGYGTDQEMCLTFALYYGFLEDYTSCRSEIDSAAYTAKYLAGARNLTWDVSRLEMVANAPPRLAGMTVSQISDSSRVNWTPAQRGRLKRDHLRLPHVEICPSRQERESIEAGGAIPPPSFVTYPIRANMYYPPQACTLTQ